MTKVVLSDLFTCLFNRIFRLFRRRLQASFTLRTNQQVFIVIKEVKKNNTDDNDGNNIKLASNPT